MTTLKSSAEDLFDIPEKANLSLADIEKAGIMKRCTTRKRIVNGELEAMRIGSKYFIPRKALIKWIESNLTVKG